MASIASISQFATGLVINFSDGSRRLMIDTGRGVWLPATGGSSGENGSGESSGNTGGSTTTPPGSVAAPVDDYPWPDAQEDALSPLRYSYRDCTDFVAWRINRDNGCTKAPWKYTWGNLRYQGPGGNGDAIGWRQDWITQNRGVDLSAAAGRIAWFGSSAGAYGHVAYVQSVTDGNVHLEEYNWGGTQAYGKRTIAASAVGSFLQIPGT